MKPILKILTLSFLLTSFTSCSLWNRVFPAKYGCSSNGKNIGAEKIIDGSKVPKAKKFKA